MDLFAMSDTELEKYASSILDELIKWGNEKNWHEWSKHFHQYGLSEENKKDVHRQWAENPALSAFKPEKVFMGALRRETSILTTWKMWNHTTEDEILGLLGFELENGDIKVCQYNVL